MKPSGSMLRSLVSTASQWLDRLNRALWKERIPNLVEEPATLPPTNFQRLEKLYLTDEVNRLVLQEYASHRKGERGKEETGWILLGHRGEKEATVLATLPAGAHRDAGVAHVLFNTTAQALASRIVRQWNKRLTILGVLHTHPGSLRHPSSGDYHGDSQWVGQLRGQEGIFGIGTADARSNGSLVATQPRKHMQCMGELCLSWYALGEGDAKYRPLEVDLTLGPDMAAPLRPLWPTIEHHAEQLERLVLQQKRIEFDVLVMDNLPFLSVAIALAKPGHQLRLLLNEQDIRYYHLRAGDVVMVEQREKQLARAVYLILAEIMNSS